MQFRLLRADELEARISRVSPKGVVILIYKDARCDQNILDETVGCMNWQRHHCRDNANCIVSIYDEKKKQWIEKEDTGKESYSEREKGLASDSFKRACFNWGIGRELYTAPFIFFKTQECKTISGRCYDKFEVLDIKYDGRKIKSVTIENTETKIIKTFSELKKEKQGKATKPQAEQKQQTEQKQQEQKISKEMIDDIEQRIVRTKSDRSKFMACFKVKNLGEMTVANGEQAIKMLELKENGNAKRNNR